MGILFTKLLGWFSHEKIKIIIIGLDNAGKTTILYQLLHHEALDTSPTIGSNVEEIQWNNLHLVMWDIGGQDSLRTSWNTYYVGTQFVVFVIDSTDRDRIPNLKKVFYEVIESMDLSKAKLLVFANKQDVADCMSPAEVSEKLNLIGIKDRTWHIQPCCALTGEGLNEGMEWIVSQKQG